MDRSNIKGGFMALNSYESD